MASADDIHDVVTAIHSRLDTINGKVTLVARAERERLLPILERAVREKPLIARIYLLLDGRRTQREISDALTEHGDAASEATVSRRLAEMSREHGIAEFVGNRGGKVYRKNREMEEVLNLTSQMEKWLDES